MGRKRTQEEYDSLLKKINPTIIRVGDYYRMDKKLKHKCLTCNYEWDVLPSSLTGTNHSGCPMCNGGTNIVVIGVNDMWTTNPELASLLANPDDGYKYTQCHEGKVRWKCPNCEAITKPKKIANVKNQGLFCEKCSDNKSLPNRIMYNLLSSLHIEFEDEVSFDWCQFELNKKRKRGIYDFYFEYNCKKYIVEMDGYWHENDNVLNGQSVDVSKYIDNEKDRLAFEHGIYVIRIPCIPSKTYAIKENILNSELSNIFNLTSINWNECFYKSIRSIMKEVCLDYKNGLSITNLAKKYKKDKCTIMKYLDCGTEIGLCLYNHDDNKRHVVCLNDGKYYDMINDASDYYNITSSSIQSCCNGKTLNAGNGVDEYSLPLVFAYYDDYMTFSNLDIVQKIQKSILFKYYDKMVICLNTKTVFKTTIDAQKWCNCSITANLYEPEKHTYSGKHPITKEKLKWMKLKDYAKSASHERESA